MGKLTKIWDVIRAFVISGFFIFFFNFLLGSLIFSSTGEPLDDISSFNQYIIDLGALTYFFIVIFSVVTTHFLYVLYSKKISKKSLELFKIQGSYQDSWLGSVLAFLLFTLIVFIMWVAGILSFTGVKVTINILIPLALAIQAAYSEELVLRGILYRRLHNVSNHSIALVVTSLIFGFLHIINPGATVLSAINIVITAGIILGAGYALTGRLWFSIFFHLLWNFTQGGIYSLNISGIATGGLIKTTIQGSAILTGGQFGPEASILTTIVLGPVSVIMLYMLYAKKDLGLSAVRYLEKDQEEEKPQY